MRITQNLLLKRTIESFQKNMRTLADVQNKLSTGKKYQVPSDDVVAYSKSMNYRQEQQMIAQHVRNINEGVPQLSFIEGTMEAVTVTLARAQELAVKGANGTESAETRASIAAEVGTLKEHMLSLANSRLNGNYVFSGFKSDTEAFDPSGTYQGTSDLKYIRVDSNNEIAVNVTGDVAFTQGGKSFINVLDDFKTALDNNDIQGIRTSLEEIRTSLYHSVDVRAEIGARLNALETHLERQQDVDLSLKLALSSLEDADIAETVVDLSRSEVALQALRESASRILSNSLMDYLR